ncbi:hypothetical protein [Sporomusa sphaeroides]|uniref:hypothetical protein n=1 Tax=Sporomusa sphaeroides TaxID=47679 RepID=UPI002CC17745|nr:hypothetical protein [Sporomusa sphaeroides]HML35141.1 hypothetical protein [Sporomusa sphaeroides]
MVIWQRNDAVRERAREIAGIFIKNGFGFLVKDLGLHRFMAFSALSGGEFRKGSKE